MPRLESAALIEHFDRRVDGRTGAVGLVSAAEGERILRALLVAYLRATGATVTDMHHRPRTTVDGRQAVLDELLLLERADRQELLSVEYKFWTASSYQAASVPDGTPLEEHAWQAWHEGAAAWQGALTSEDFFGWTQAAKVLGHLDRQRLPATVRGLPVRPVLAVWTPLLARPSGSGVCWTEARLADAWHERHGYSEPLTVFSGSLFARAHGADSVEIDLDTAAAFGRTIRSAMDIVHDLVRD